MNRRSLALVFGTAVISGVSIFVNGILVQTMSSGIFTFLKNSTVVAFIVAIMIGLGQWKELRRLTGRQWLLLATIGLVGGSIPFLLFFQGLSMTSGTAGSFLHKTMFVFVALFAGVFLRERFRPAWFLGALCLLVGNAIFLKADLASFSMPHLLILAATLLWAIENTLSKYVLGDLSANTVIFGRMAFGAVFMALYLAFSGELWSLPAALNPANLWTIGITSVLLLAYVLTWYHGIKDTSVSTATCILLLGSPVTTLLAVVFQSKTITLPQLHGTWILVLGTAFMLLSHMKQRQSALSTA